MAQEKMERKDILWVGKVGGDPFHARCAARLSITDFSNLYDALAEVLSEGAARVLVVNALTAGPQLARNLKTISSQGLFQAIYVYSTLPRMVQYRPNGDGRVAAAETPEQLLGRLIETLKPPEPVVAAAVEPQQTPPSDAGQLAAESPREVGRKINIVVSSPGEDRAVEVPPAEPNPDASRPMPVRRPPPKGENDFTPAELTPEELRALLGIDQTENESKS